MSEVIFSALFMGENVANAPWSMVAWTFTLHSHEFHGNITNLAFLSIGRESRVFEILSVAS